jgi:integrase
MKLVNINAAGEVDIFKNADADVFAKVEKAMLNYIFANYEKMIQTFEGVANRTKLQYLKLLKSQENGFLRFLEKSGLNVYSIKFYKLFLQAVKISNDTKNGYLSAAKALVKSLQDVAPLANLIKIDYKNFNVTTGHRKTGLSGADVVKVGNYIKSIKKETTRLKTFALHCLMAFEGLRQMEAANLPIDKVNLKDGTLVIKGKGGSEKLVNIKDATKKALIEWLEFSKPTMYVFESSRKAGHPITERAVRKMFVGGGQDKDGNRITGIFERAGVVGRSVHGYRHFNLTAANDAFNGDIHKVAKFGRHKHVQTTMNYIDGHNAKKDNEVFNDYLNEGGF